MLRVFGGGAGGGGVTTYVALTDAATADLPTVNAPLAAVLALKLEANPPLALTAGFTVAKASHANRNIGILSASPVNVVFDGTAAFTTDDGFTLFQQGAGAITLQASGVTFTNPYGLSLTTTGVGTWITAQWDAVLGQLNILQKGSAPSAGGGAITRIAGATAVAIAGGATNAKSQSITIPAGTLGRNGAIRLTFTGAKTGAVEAASFSVRFGAVGFTFSSAAVAGNNNIGTAVGTFVAEVWLFGNGVDNSTVLAAAPGGSVNLTTTNPVVLATLTLNHGTTDFEIAIGGNGGATTGTWIVSNSQCLVIPAT